MNTKEFESFWKSKFPEGYPIGYKFRSIYKERWFRIHSLPHSKRHAETEDEYKIILSRQNEIITELFGARQDDNTPPTR